MSLFPIFAKVYCILWMEDDVGGKGAKGWGYRNEAESKGKGMDQVSLNAVFQKLDVFEAWY